LDHKISDNPMKFSASIVISTTEFSKVSTGVGGMIPVQFYNNFSHPMRSGIFDYHQMSNVFKIYK